MFGSFVLLVLYAIATLTLKSRSVEVSPAWMPHGAFVFGATRMRLVYIVWLLPVLVGGAMAMSAAQADVGAAILSLLALVLLCGLTYGLVDRATEAAHAPAPGSVPPIPAAAPESTLVEARRGGPMPLDAKPVAPGLHFTNLATSPEEIVHHVPRAIADRILAELDLSKRKSEQIVASNTQLSSESQQQKEYIAELEKKFSDTEQALNELSRINQTLRSKSASNEKPFAQMNVEEIDKARETREREIRTLDEMRRAKLQAQRTGGG